MIVVKPIGGLANRMRVLYASVLLAERYNTKLRCVWQNNEELGAAFHDIFLPIPNVEFCADYGKLISTYNKKGLNLLISRIWNRIKGIGAYFSPSNVDAINKVGTDSEDYSCFFSVVSKYLANNRSVAFSTCNYLMVLPNADIFHPVQELMDEIDRISDCFTANTYGLHIRRTDHMLAINGSPDEAFFKIIDDCLSEDGNCMFFLSTDDKNVETLFKNKYEGHILVHDKTFGRGSLSGIKDAVIDMWLLSRTNRIYGSSYSSFSGMASLINGVPSFTVKL